MFLRSNLTVSVFEPGTLLNPPNRRWGTVKQHRWQVIPRLLLHRDRHLSTASDCMSSYALLHSSLETRSVGTGFQMLHRHDCASCNLGVGLSCMVIRHIFLFATCMLACMRSQWWSFMDPLQCWLVSTKAQPMLYCTVFFTKRRPPGCMRAADTEIETILDGACSFDLGNMQRGKG